MSSFDTKRRYLASAPDSYAVSALRAGGLCGDTDEEEDEEQQQQQQQHDDERLVVERKDGGSSDDDDDDESGAAFDEAVLGFDASRGLAETREERAVAATRTTFDQVDLVDEDADAADERWVRRALRGSRKRATVLSCPACFTPLTYQCQAHATIARQWRALFVVNCLVRRDHALVSESSGARFAPVACAACGAEVGVKHLDGDERDVFVFFDVLPASELCAG